MSKKKKEQPDFFQLPVQMGNIYKKADRTLKLQFYTTKEIKIKARKALLDYEDCTGILLFKADEQQYKEEEIPDVDSGSATLRPSQKLRLAINDLWALSDKSLSKQDFYEDQMQMLINKYKLKVNNIKNGNKQ